MRYQVIDDLIETHMPPKSYADQWDTEGLYAACLEHLGVDMPVIEWGNEEGVDDEVMRERLSSAVDEAMAKKAIAFGPIPCARSKNRFCYRQLTENGGSTCSRWNICALWSGSAVMHSATPSMNIKTNRFQLFESMLDSLRNEVTQKLAQIRPMTGEEQRAMAEQMARTQQAALKQASQTASEAAPAAVFDETDPSTWGNPGRNEPCPCGSGKKFKHCHGQI